MLVLTRQLEEEIMIGEDITVKVVDFRDGKVRLGITAPRSVRVDRREVREAMERDAAAQEVK